MFFNFLDSVNEFVGELGPEGEADLALGLDEVSFLEAEQDDVVLGGLQRVAGEDVLAGVIERLLVVLEDDVPLRDVLLRRRQGQSLHL